MARSWPIKVAPGFGLGATSKVSYCLVLSKTKLHACSKLNIFKLIKTETGVKVITLEPYPHPPLKKRKETKTNVIIDIAQYHYL